MDCVHDHQQRRIEDRYLAHIKVTKCDQLNTLLVEEAPEINQLHRTTKKYLIAEAVLGVYLLLCIVFGDNTAYTKTDPARKVKIFFFLCSLPFVILRVIAMMCCKSPKTVLFQVFGIWLSNFILYGIWSAWALVSLLTMDDAQPVNLALVNMALLLVLYSPSICGTFCALPFFAYKIYARIDSEVADINLKIWQIKSLPQIPFDPDKFTAYAACSICMEEFKRGSPVTYLPCNPNHYFDTKCITFWLLKQSFCPICKVGVNYDRAFKQATTTTYE